MKIIAIANQKGGVSKTTTTGAFAAGLKKKGFRVLAIDLDPQGNLSGSVGADFETDDSIFELLKRESTCKGAIQHLDMFDIIPANIGLACAENEITKTGKELRLKEVMEEIDGQYDYVIIDTPPSLGLLTIMAFTYAQEVIIPSNASYFSAIGIVQLKDTIDNIKKYTNPNLRTVGILLTAYSPRTNLTKTMTETTQLLSKSLNAPLFHTTIRIATAMGEAQSVQQDIFSFAPKSTVAIDYEAFIDEYLELEGK